jgi:O-antigen ligase
VGNLGLVLTQATPWLINLLVFLAITQLIINKRILNQVIISYIGISLFVSFLILIQSLIGTEIILLGAHQLKSFHGSIRIYSDSNALLLISLSLMSSLMVKAKGYRKTFLLVSIGIIVIGLALSISRAIIISAGLIILANILIEKPKRTIINFFLIISIFVCLLIFLGFSNTISSNSYIETITYWMFDVLDEGIFSFPSIANRFVQFRYALNEWIKSPLVGNGFGTGFIEGYLVGKPGIELETIKIHNSFLQIAMQTGIIGLLPLTIWIITSLRVLFPNPKKFMSEWVTMQKGFFIGLVVFWIVSNVVVWGISATSISQIMITVAIGSSGHYYFKKSSLQ